MLHEPNKGNEDGVAPVSVPATKSSRFSVTKSQLPIDTSAPSVVSSSASVGQEKKVLVCSYLNKEVEELREGFCPVFFF